MKRFIVGVLFGLIVGWLTLPVVKASYDVINSDGIVMPQINDNDTDHAYKWFLAQILSYMKQTNQHLQNIEDNTKAVREKFHA